jgi:RNA polymerase sigma-70 factor (ECF subfamily)
MDMLDVMAGRSVAAAEGGQATFESLLATCARHAFDLACAMLGDPQDAEDAVQEAALKAWAKFGGLRPDSSFRAWFLTIVANQCRSMRRTRWWRLRHALELPEVPLAGHEDRAVSRLDLVSLLRQLPPEQQGLLYLYFELDLPHAEIGRILRLRTGTVKTRLHRVVTRLRRSVEEDPAQ